MMYRPGPIRVSCWLLTLILVQQTAAQSSLILPASAANAAGSAANWAPLGSSPAPVPGVRMQTTYSATELTSQNVNQLILIRGLRWRPDEWAPSVVGGQFQDLEVRLSTSPGGWSAVGSDFAANHGSDLTLAYDARVHGPVTYQATPGPTRWTQGTRCVDIRLAQPFLYDPTQGDLVVDIDHPSAGFVGTRADVDASSGVGSSVLAGIFYPVASTILYIDPPVLELDYGPAIGLFPEFALDLSQGPSPLTVQFSDRSFSSAASGVTSWAWDFDNDGTVDSTVQNPTHTFTNCGTYDVTLTVGDGTHAPASHTRLAAVVTDELTAAFDATVIAPRVLQFTDRSSPDATAWAWDLDGDQIVDSTLRSPTWAYATTAPVDVTLTVSRLCGPSDSITKTVTPLEQLATPLNPVTFSFAGWTSMFDVEVKAREGLDILSLEINQGPNAWRPFTLDIWLTGDGYDGKQAAAASWQLAATVPVTPGSSSTTVTVTLPQPLHLPRGRYGMALHIPNLGIRVTSPSSAGLRIENADLAVEYGVLRMTSPAYPFGPASELPLRLWAGMISYSKCRVSGHANHGFLGEGCAGSLGRATLTATALPRLGSTVSVDLDGLPTNAAILALGFDNRTSPLGPLPFALDPFGLPGCRLRVRPDATLALFGSGGTATWQLPIPNDPALTCVTMFQQAAVFDPGTNPAGMVVSDAAGFVIGN
ncbi:MAG: PKD domain-containing protein [bacterium]|nr:PKD domain-containing protein [bacterium]